MAQLKNNEAFTHEDISLQGVSSGASVDKGSMVDSSDVREALTGVAIEGGETTEDGVEFSMGNVSEATSGSKDNYASTGSTSGDDDFSFQNLRKQLKDSKPSQGQMLGDIKRHFKGEKRILKKDMKKYMKKSDWGNYNDAVFKLRKISAIFSNLAHATYDTVKNVWLKVVHGIV